MTTPVTFLDGRVTLYQGDCREILPTLPKVDAVVTDPPYVALAGPSSGQDRAVFGGVGRRIIGRDKAVGDPWQASFDWAPIAFNVASTALIVFCSNRGIAVTEAAFPGTHTVCVLTWHKKNAPPTPRHVPRFTTEHIICLQKNVGFDWHAYGSTLIDIPGLPAGCFATERIVENGKSIHPTQKPIAVMDAILRPCRGRICDPFMGLGATGLAAIASGLEFVGIEIEPRYFDIACRRIEEATKQPDMFVEPATPAPTQETLAL